MASGIITKNDAFKFAQTWVDNKNEADFKCSVNYENSKSISNENIVVAYFFEILPTGFIFISSSTDVGNENPVIAYSFSNDFKLGVEEEKIAFDIIRKIGHNDIMTSQSGSNNSHSRKISNTTFENGPFIQSLWGQVNCTDNNGSLVNVSNYYTPNNYAPGCVAISMATLLHHYLWPVNGTGSNTYTDNYGSSKGTYSANFEDTYYGWENMLNRYKNKVSTDYQRESQGLLVYQTAIALNMDFEYNGSTSNVNQIPNAGDKFFRFSSVHRYEYSSVFWQLLDTNIFAEIPVILSVSGNGYGHSIVCDGIRIESDSTHYYHLNMGWWGSSNGWYRIRDNFNAGGYSSITGGVFNFVPIPSLSTPIVDETDETVTLNWQYPTNFIADAFEIQQKINEESWTTISDEILDTTIDVNIDPSVSYAFRVRAKYKGKWNFSSWSNESQMEYLGINDVNRLDGISYGPNPIKNTFTIFYKDMSPSVSINIYNSIGAKIHSLNREENMKKTTFSTSEWISGIYFIRISDGDKRRVISIIKN